MKDYNELELALTENSLNLDSLTRAFFPPNEPPSPFVEVVYWITSGTIDPDQQRLLQGMQGPPRSSDDTFWNISEYDTWYKYWWSESPIYLFMDSGILERLALFTISVPYYTAQIFINRSFCEDYTIQNIPLPQYHLNQMTTLVSAGGAAIFRLYLFCACVLRYYWISIFTSTAMPCQHSKGQRPPFAIAKIRKNRFPLQMFCNEGK